MAKPLGIFISQPTKSVTAQGTPIYEFNMISSRGALLERKSGIAWNPTGFINHDTKGAIPLALGFTIDSAKNVHGARIININDKQILNNLFSNTYYRIFYNQQKVTP